MQVEPETAGSSAATTDRVEAADVAVAGAGESSTPAAPSPAGNEPVGENVFDGGALEAVLESLLLAAGAPVPLGRLVSALEGPSRGEVARALRALAERFESEGRGIRLVEVAGGFQLRSAPQHGPFVRRLLGGRPPRLSRPMLETLAIVAYRQPCTRPEIEAIRGVDCGTAIGSLLERRLIRLVGRKEAPGRPLLYGTTREFLEVFGLPDLDALPPLRELGPGAEVLAATDGNGALPRAAELVFGAGIPQALPREDPDPRTLAAAVAGESREEPDDDPGDGPEGTHDEGDLAAMFAAGAGSAVLAAGDAVVD